MRAFFFSLANVFREDFALHWTWTRVIFNDIINLVHTCFLLMIKPTHVWYVYNWSLRFKHIQVSRRKLSRYNINLPKLKSGSSVAYQTQLCLIKSKTEAIRIRRQTLFFWVYIELVEYCIYKPSPLINLICLQGYIYETGYCLCLIILTLNPS